MNVETITVSEGTASEGNELTMHSKRSMGPYGHQPVLVNVMISESKVVFIACGQVTEQEKQLGRKIVWLVEELTPFKAYLAQYQSSLESLTENLLKTLGRSVGLIVVMHPRGKVIGLKGESHTRGSIWIEQELAIAAFLTQVLRKRLKVAVYIHKDIKREGIRQELYLNPVRFERNQDVLLHLMGALPEWKKERLKEKRNPGSLGEIA